MTTSPIGLNRFIVAQFEGQSRWIKTATHGLTDEQLHYRPTADTNSISLLADMALEPVAGPHQLKNRIGRRDLGIGRMGGTV